MPAEPGAGAAEPLGQNHVRRLVALRFAWFYVAMFGTFGLFLPYWPVWLAARGLSASEIGWVLGVSFWPRIVTSLVLPLWADQHGTRRRMAIWLAAITLLGLIVFGLVHDYWLYLLLSLITGASYAAILPLGEALCLHSAARHRLDYGRIRLWGSLCFMLVSVAGGYGLERWGAAIIWPLVLLGTAATLQACWTLPEIALKGGSPARHALGQLLRRPGLISLTIGANLIQASHALFYGFGTLHWRAAGHSEGTIGWLWAEGVLAEVLLFALGSTLLRRYHPCSLIALAGLLAAVRWLGDSLTTALPVLVVTQALHAASFATTHLAAMHALRSYLPATLQASAQGFYSALGLAPMFAILTPLSGWLYTQLGGQAFLVMAALALLGAGIVLTARPALRR